MNEKERVRLLLALKDLAEKVAVFGSLEAYCRAVEDYWRRKTKEAIDMFLEE